MLREYGSKASLLAGALIVALLAVSCSSGTSEKADSAKSTGATLAPAMTQVQRGEYLTYIGGCHDCHTPGTFYNAPDWSRRLSGSELGWQGPWGVSYPRNLTPDSTGLASYTDADIERVLRSGIRKNGEAIRPPMPWPNYSRLTPDDMAALIAYLRSLPPISHVPPKPIPPGGKPAGPRLIFPPPPAWDVPPAKTK